jgi:hypothetical protein
MLNKYNVYNSYFKEFKEFHDHKYKIEKGEHIIWIEFYLFVFIFSMLVISYALVSFTDPGEVPDDKIWKIEIEDDLPDHIKVEQYMNQLNRREEILNYNRNIISEDNLNDSRSTSSKYFFIT